MHLWRSRISSCQCVYRHCWGSRSHWYKMNNITHCFYFSHLERTIIISIAVGMGIRKKYWWISDQQSERVTSSGQVNTKSNDMRQLSETVMQGKSLIGSRVPDGRMEKLPVKKAPCPVTGSCDSVRMRYCWSTRTMRDKRWHPYTDNEVTYSPREDHCSKSITMTLTVIEVLSSSMSCILGNQWFLNLDSITRRNIICFDIISWKNSSYTNQTNEWMLFLTHTTCLVSEIVCAWNVVSTENALTGSLAPRTRWLFTSPSNHVLIARWRCALLGYVVTRKSQSS